MTKPLKFEQFEKLRSMLGVMKIIEVGIQGVQFLKPNAQNDVPSSMLTANGVKKLTDADGGIGLEVGLILQEDNIDDEMVNWEVENLKFSIKQPVVVTKDEFQSLTFLCKSEIESMGRITAGILRLLKLECSVGQSVMVQLGNLVVPARPLLLLIYQVDPGYMAYVAAHLPRYCKMYQLILAI
ncbi:hypothetical protein KIW84_013393 [Lathyrus oleraceus]|uniref:Uncharacterized protein n=1 Tax=Pisum sativum TaxID=3888 RepID=A0A9D5BKA0_PEA|nr:hypothetical protein KIW84_013393 [Pisum sativum]